MKGRVALALAVLLAGCEAEPEAASAEPVEAGAAAEIDPALLRELLGESLQIEGDRIRADGMLIRLAFDPLIRQTGPVSVQLVQGQGYRLSGIADGSPLWLLGLRDGDVLTGVDKQAIIGREHELRSTYESRPSQVELTFMRGTEAHTVNLRIAVGSAWRSRGADPLDTPPLRPPLPATTSAEPTVDVASGLRCVAGDSDDQIGRCELLRETLDALRNAPETLMRQARVVPSTREGESVGFKLYGIRVNSLPHVLGIKNGDLLEGINGRELGSLEAAMATFEALATETKLTVAIERKGQDMTLEIEIVDKLSGPPASLRGDSERNTSPDLRDPFAGR